MDRIAIHEVFGIGNICAKKKPFGTDSCDAIHISAEY